MQMPSAGDFIAYENGELTAAEVRRLFQLLVDTGMVWRMPSPFPATAADMLAAGYIRHPAERPS